MRLFVALDLPADVRAALASLVSGLRKTCHGPRWVRLEGVHITLKFLGEVPDAQLTPISAALGEIRGMEPVAMRFAGLGFFRDERRPRVLWAGIEAGPALAALASEVRAKLESVGFPKDDREYQPHITLARIEPTKESMQDVDRLRAAVAENVAREFGHATADKFYLYRSVLKPGGAEYTRLSAYPFAGDRTS